MLDYKNWLISHREIKLSLSYTTFIAPESGLISYDEEKIKKNIDILKIFLYNSRKVKSQGENVYESYLKSGCKRHG